MSERVLDASVILALLKGEPVQDFVLQAIEGAVMSAVNIAEVYTKANELQQLHSQELAALLGLLDRIEPFTHSQARLSAMLRTQTKPYGLSLGDCACLALTLELKAEVFTAERLWAELQLLCPIHLIR